MTNFFIGMLLVIHFIVGIFLVVIVLMQRTKEGGMGAAFGAGVTESLFGASSGNVLTKITVWTAAIFFVTSLSMAIIFSHRGGTSIGRSALQQVPKAEIPSAGTATPQGTLENNVLPPAPNGINPPPVVPQGTLELPKTPEGGEKQPSAEPAPAPVVPPVAPPNVPQQPEAPKANP